MAKSEHIALLKDGIEAWNDWRRAKPRQRPDLRNASLGESDFRGFDLRFADLHGARLHNAKLSRCRMQSADLSDTFLHAARLTGANLTGANLTRADLSLTHLDRTVLRSANLSRAQFRASRLAETDFRTAILDRTAFQNVNLGRVKGLLEVVHRGPSFIDAQSLVKSGTLPINFLRGCGIPEQLIKHLPTLLNSAMRFPSCFISYSTKDQAFAERLHGDLQDEGVRCWFAPHDIRGGRKLHEQIDEAISLHDRLLLILSEHSMSSEWVKTEIAHARQKELSKRCQVLFPISLVHFTKIQEWKCFDSDTGKDSAREIREYFIRDFSNWQGDDFSYKKTFQSLVADLQLKETDDAVPE